MCCTVAHINNLWIGSPLSYYEKLVPAAGASRGVGRLVVAGLAGFNFEWPEHSNFSWAATMEVVRHTIALKNHCTRLLS
jgi:hypothetical protein